MPSLPSSWMPRFKPIDRTGSGASRLVYALVAGLVVGSVGCSDLPMEGAGSSPPLAAAEAQVVKDLLSEPARAGTGSTICEALDRHHHRAILEAGATGDPEHGTQALELEALIANLCR